MDSSDLVTDMALDVLERRGEGDRAQVKELSYGIVRKFLHLRSPEDEKRTGRPKGIYLTYDCSPSVFASERGVRALKHYLSSALVELAGVMGRRSKVLAVGLGNDEVTADSLGSAVTDMLEISPASDGDGGGERGGLCAFETGVEGRTGIRSADAVAGVCAKLRPACVLTVDSLVTSTVSRLGASFQLTTAGIAPGSGVGRDRERIDRETLGVPVVSIGVPTVLSMRTVLSDFISAYSETTGCERDEFRLRSTMSEMRLSSLIVAPKEVKLHVLNAAEIIADAINAAFGANCNKRRLG